MQEANPRLVVLDVGHGNCAVLHDAEGVVVFDAGTGSNLLEYLTDCAVSKIDAVVLSHADKDHIAGLIGLLGSNQFSIGSVWLNSDGEKGSRVWDDLRYELDQLDSDGHIGFEISLTPDCSGSLTRSAVHIEVLGPSKYLASGGPGSKDREGRKVTSNSISAVIRLGCDEGGSILLTGDLDKVGLDDMTQRGASMSAQVLVYPHHGGLPGRDDPDAFARELHGLVTPEEVIFSIGRGVHGTPRPEAVEALRTSAPAVRVLCTQLSTHCASAVVHPAPSDHLLPIHAKGRERGHCCAGSVVIPLGMTEPRQPTLEKHAAFVASAAPTALCRPDRSARPTALQGQDGPLLDA